MPVNNSCGGTENADTIFDQLTGDDSFDFPDINLSGKSFEIPSEKDNPLYKEVMPVSVEDLTTRVLQGSGVFDAMMDAVSIHLKAQYEADRISGREYADVYTASLQTAMGQAVSFLMGKDSAYWQAVSAQTQARTAEVQAVTARIQLENTKLQYYALKANAKTAAAEYAIKKLQLSLMDQEYCIKVLEKEALGLDIAAKEYTNTHILPAQKEQIQEQTNQTKETIIAINWDSKIKKFEHDTMLPKRSLILDSEVQSAALDRQMKKYTLDNIMPWQKTLTQEQAETARASTMGTRSDGSEISGIIGWDNKTKKFTLENLLPAQRTMLLEQVEGARAQTLNTRTDGTTVVGLVGKQKDLYTQQIESYKRDAETKAAKMFIDSWVTQKTIDEGLSAPGALQNASVDTVMNRIKINNNLNT